jgi:hypothetical protein
LYSGLTRRALYHLIHTQSPFWFFSYFSDRFLLLPENSLTSYSPYISLLCTYDYRQVSPSLPCLLKSSLTNFLPRLSSNCDPPNLQLLCSWNYRFVPLCLAQSFFLKTIEQQSQIRKALKRFKTASTLFLYLRRWTIKSF